MIKTNNDLFYKNIIIMVVLLLMFIFKLHLTSIFTNIFKPYFNI